MRVCVYNSDEVCIQLLEVCIQLLEVCIQLLEQSLGASVYNSHEVCVCSSWRKSALGHAVDVPSPAGGTAVIAKRTGVTRSGGDVLELSLRGALQVDAGAVCRRPPAL